MDYARTTYNRNPALFTERVLGGAFPDQTYMVSPAYGINGLEQHHHKVILKIEGSEPLKVRMGYYSRDDVDNMLAQSYNSFGWTLAPGTHTLEFEARYGNRDWNWWMYEAGKDARISEINHTYYEGPTSWLAERPIQQVDFMGGRARYYLSTPPNQEIDRKYPLIVSVGGSGELGDDGAILTQVDPACILRKDYKTYTDFPAFYCTYQVPTSGFDGSLNPEYPYPYHSGWNQYYGVGTYGMVGLRLLVTKLLVEYPDIDPKRLYLTGFSGGAKLCFEALKAQRDIWAAVVPCAGWPIGNAYNDIENHPNWDTPFDIPNGLSYKNRLKREISQNMHTGVLIGAGSSDGMRFGSMAYEKLARDLGRQVIYREYPSSHGGTSKRVWGDFGNVEWLMAQRLPDVIPTDPYPDFKYETSTKEETMDINLRALGQGYFKVIVNGSVMSQHVQEREASQEAINAKLADPTAEVVYKHDYEVVVETNITTPNEY